MEIVTTALAESYKNVFRHSSTGMILFRLNPEDSELTITDINEEAERILKLSPEELIGSHFSSAFPHHANDPIRKTIEDVIVGNLENQHLSFSFLHDSERIVTDLFVYRTGDYCACADFKDRTKEAKIENSLRISSKKYQVLMDALPIGVVVTSDQGEILDLNNRAIQIAGLKLNTKLTAFLATPEVKIIDLEGNPIPYEQLPSVRALFNNTIAEQTLGLMKNGVTRWLSVTCAPISLPGFGILVAIKEMTEQIVTLKELNANKKQLQSHIEEIHSTNVLNTELLAILAHDIRSPFQGILGFSSLVAEMCKESENDELVHYSNELDTAINKHYHFINDLMEWIRFRQEHKTIKMVPVNIEEIIVSVLVTLSTTARNKRIHVKYSSEAELMALGDANMLALVIRNLLSNAIKFSQKHSMVTIIAHTVETGVSVSVVDEGIGLEKNRIANLFNERVSTRGTVNEKGSGIGLKLAYDAIKQMGGTISVKSELGFGSRFTFILPKA